MKNKAFKITLFLIGMMVLVGCPKDEPIIPIEPEPILETDIEFSFVQTVQGTYSIGEEVTLSSFEIINTSNTKVEIAKFTARIRGIGDDTSLIEETVISENIEILLGDSFQVDEKALFTIPQNFQNDSYALSLYIKFSDEGQEEHYKTFFRVIDSSTQVTYEINEENYQGLPVYLLRNGLSAEYTIQKSAASFLSGISHSWESPLGPIASTPDFLERSLNKTIDFYDSTIGNTTAINTVIIAPGSPGVPYLARAMNAVVLPMHYLVGSGTIMETQTILEHANNTGYSAYGTLGYDYSITDTEGVAWIKLLEIPEQYKQFIEDHQVENVILLGHVGSVGGETLAKKVADTRAAYEEGSLYIMYFSGTASEGYLNPILSDFGDARLSNEVGIADWEAGILEDQIENYSTYLKSNTNVSTVTAITATEGGHLWDFGTYVSLELISKNKSIFEVGGPAVRGISLNPYLVANPSYESWIRHVPFLYWQGFDAEFQYNYGLIAKIKPAIQTYFPEIVFENLNFWVNSSNNFGTASQGNAMATYLESKGLNVQANDFNVDEVWNLMDGINSSTEIRAENIVNSSSASAYKSWNESLQYLDVNDLQDISNKFPEIKTNLQ